ncbi:MAG: hypothetical protein WC355_01740 [Candidatus Omnitrophota bacterium]|jgi:hypothetical protein
MRDLLFKNLTSSDHKKRIICSSEVSEKQGVHSVIRRHFICMVKEINNQDMGMDKPQSCLYVLKERDSKEQKQKFFCKVKGSIYAVNGDKLFLIVFMHSLRIDLVSAPQSVS